ncbi:hypothetical protein AVEN_80593-1 [Araneus ventricosus]|uniref:Peptidase S1 domain-containing protein n=1 Tax=Araneus ventricosus TaxID=182803 RepID=A0A4Y2VGI6_ARAVE|nr:hypothetical protein AVEN_80593-1 [Araneus ventricosus]
MNATATISAILVLMPLDARACLHIPHYDPAGVGENATVLGWGDTSFNVERRKSGLGTEMLQRVDDLIIYPKEDCRNIMSRIAGRLLPDNFGEYYICAGVPDGSKDACIVSRNEFLYVHIYGS